MGGASAMTEEELQKALKSISQTRQVAIANDRLGVVERRLGVMSDRLDALRTQLAINSTNMTALQSHVTVMQQTLVHRLTIMDAKLDVLLMALVPQEAGDE